MKIFTTGSKLTLVAFAVAGLAGCFDGNGKDDLPDVNNPPNAMAIDIVTQTETAFTESFPASDPDQDVLTFTIDTQPTSGSVSNNNDGSFTYSPFAELTGVDSFSFTVRDSDGLEDSATVGITIEALQVSFTQYARDAFSAETYSTPLPLNGREFTQDGVNSTDYQDLIDNN